MRKRDPEALARIASHAAANATRFLHTTNYLPLEGSNHPARGGHPGPAVVTSRPLPTAGGSVVALAPRARVTVTVPQGAFPLGATVQLSEPDISEVAGGVLGVGVRVMVDGSALAPRSDRPLTLAIDSPEIRLGDQVEIWDGSSFNRPPESSVVSGRAVLTLTGEPDVVIVLEGPSAP